MAGVSLPTSISCVAAELAGLPGVVAVVLGGSRAAATHRPDSDFASAVLCVAHARLAERHEWVLNEKRLAQRADLDDAHALLARAGETASELHATVAAVSELLRVPPLTIRQ